MSAFQQALLLGLEACLVGGLILFLFHVRHRVGLSPLYIAVGTFQYLTVILAMSLAIEIRPGLLISPGSTILFPATLFAILLVYVHEDAEETRLLVYGLAIANTALVLLSNLFGQHFDSPLARNYLELPRELFSQDVSVMLLGTALLVVDGILLILIFEALGRILPRSNFLRTTLTLLPVAAFDGLVFVTGLAYGRDGYSTMLVSNLTGKLISALFFSIVLAIYMRWSRARFDQAETGPLNPGEAFRMLTFRQKYKQLKQSKEAVSEISERLNLALSAARVGTWDWYPKDDRLVWDDHMFRLFGVERASFRGVSQDFFEAVHPEDRGRLEDELESADLKHQVDTTYRVPLPDGRTRYICDRARPYRNEHGGVERMIGVCWDVTEQKVAENELTGLTQELSIANVRLEDQATHDPLTGLLNRRGLETAIARELDRIRRSGENSVAILIDCDDFKGINDTYGHHVGDAVLVNIGQTLERTLRRGDLVGRIGGDEFLAFLPETRVAEAETVAEKLRTAVTTTPPAGFDQVVSTISLGATSIPENTTTLGQIVALTQAVLKQSKAAGKDQTSIDRSSKDTDSGIVPVPPTEQLIRDGQLESIAHPIFDLVEQRVVAHEFVLRGPPGDWELPERLFSRTICGPNLHQFDVATAISHLEAARNGIDLSDRVHLNLLPTTLLSNAIPPLFDRIAKQPQNQICFELREQGFVGDPIKYAPAIENLRSFGATFALDGIALSKPALELLLLLEPEFVKIDRSAFEGVVHNPGVKRRLGRLLRVVRSLGARTIAVGIESQAEQHALLEQGLAYGQGTLWAEQTLRIAIPPSMTS